MRLAVLAAACSALLLAACDRPDPKVASPSAASGASATGQADRPDRSQARTPSTPADLGRPSADEQNRESNLPQQGQVDPKHSPQHRDFQQGSRSDQPAPATR